VFPAFSQLYQREKQAIGLQFVGREMLGVADHAAE
jgi:hypothetical protein